jgi:hypothetical protein
MVNIIYTSKFLKNYNSFTFIPFIPYFPPLSLFSFSSIFLFPFLFPSLSLSFFLPFLISLPAASCFFACSVRLSLHVYLSQCSQREAEVRRCSARQLPCEAAGVVARQPHVPAPPRAHLYPAMVRARRARPLSGREAALGAGQLRARRRGAAVAYAARDWWVSWFEAHQRRRRRLHRHGISRWGDAAMWPGRRTRRRESTATGSLLLLARVDRAVSHSVRVSSGISSVFL